MRLWRITHQICVGRAVVCQLRDTACGGCMEGKKKPNKSAILEKKKKKRN